VYTDVNFKTHYSPACSPSLAGIGAIFVILVEIDRYVYPRLLPLVDLEVMNDKPLNELMGVMNRSLIRDCPMNWAVYDG